MAEIHAGGGQMVLLEKRPRLLANVRGAIIATT